MDERLLRKAMQGDADAFGALCTPYEGMVYRHCLQMLRNPADAQDAAQEAMLRAYRAMPRFKGDSGIATWLYRIAHNACLDMLKRPLRKRESVSLDDMRESGYEPAADSTPETRYLEQSEAARVRDALLQLPEDTQALLALRYGEGMAYDQLAAALKLNEGTVKSRLSRAKEKLRELLEKDRP